MYDLRVSKNRPTWSVPDARDWRWQFPAGVQRRPGDVGSADGSRLRGGNRAGQRRAHQRGRHLPAERVRLRHLLGAFVVAGFVHGRDGLEPRAGQGTERVFEGL